MWINSVDNVSVWSAVVYLIGCGFTFSGILYRIRTVSDKEWEFESEYGGNWD